MGMYNQINDFEINCPFCGKELMMFQTKDGDLCLYGVSYKEVDNFYTICECGTFIELTYSPEKKERTIEDYKIKTLSKK